MPPTTSLIKLVKSGSFHGSCHCSYIFVQCLAFHVYVAGDLNQEVLFIASVLSTVHSCFTWAHLL